MNQSAQLSQPPQFSDAEMQQCRKSGDFRPILFEWYKYVGQVCLFFAQLQIESPAVKNISPVHFAILTGLLNRCARLMLSNMALSHNGRFGETTALLDRCIFESCLKVEWLCHKADKEYFRRYLAEGLKTEVELEKEIKSNIAGRTSRRAVVIENRMLRSIENHIKASGLSREEITETKKMPDAASMMRDLGYERLTYVIAQRMGSHHIHGTWSSLLFHYLEVDQDTHFSLRDHDCEIYHEQFVMISLQVLTATRAFIFFVVETEDAEEIVGLLDSIQEEILKINDEKVSGDFQEVIE